jgi:hypothetical protein
MSVGETCFEARDSDFRAVRSFPSFVNSRTYLVSFAARVAFSPKLASLPTFATAPTVPTPGIIIIAPVVANSKPTFAAMFCQLPGFPTSGCQVIAPITEELTLKCHPPAKDFDFKKLQISHHL